MALWQIPDGLGVVEVNAYPLAYFEAGTGEAIVLVHGSLNDCRSWVNQLPVLSERHRVLAPSLRHYYPERWSGQGGTFSLAQHAEDLAMFIRVLGLSPVHLIGHSRGGSVAYLVARDAPELVRSLVLAEPRGLEDLLPPAAVGSDAGGSNARIFEELNAALREGRKQEAAQRFVDTFNGPESWVAMTDLQRAIILDNIATGTDPGELPGMRCEDIARFDFPVLLVRGENSLARYRLGLEAMRRCNTAIGEVVVIPSAPHGMHRVNPKAFNTAVMRFLQSVR